MATSHQVRHGSIDVHLDLPVSANDLMIECVLACMESRSHGGILLRKRNEPPTEGLKPEVPPSPPASEPSPLSTVHGAGEEKDLGANESLLASSHHPVENSS